MSELSHITNNVTCHHYDKLENPIIRAVEYQKGENKSIDTNSNIIFIILKGYGRISFRQFTGRIVTSGDILLFPAHTQIKFRVDERAIILVFQLQPSVHFCDHYSLDTLYKQKGRREKEKFTILKINQRIKSYINSLLPCLNDGLKCHYFLDLKIKELFFLLRAYNTKADIVDFFSSMITNDAAFYAYVLANYKSVKTAGELAKKSNYTASGFEKYFKRIFGVTAHAWMKKQLSENLFHEIICTKKTFREISKEFGFSSSQHLTNFCKLNFGTNPTILRKNGGIKEKNNEL